ncbi:MFS transporter [Micromonospora sp. CPCC 206061]|uniref:MFS transporter n=1 Tax=Micromonospora sp. CPCC 206061 TaxID=3122410 RepID=UPI002FF399D4
MRSVQLVLAAATAVGSVGLAAGGTAGALIAAEMTGGTTSAGVPLGAVVVGSAAGAVLISRVTRLAGRITGLMLGYLVGAVGAALVVGAMAASNFVLVVVGNVVMGVANAAVYLARYAAADAVSASARGRALGVVLTGAAVGAVAGPNLLGPSGDLAARLGFSRLGGLYLVAVVAFPTAGAILALLGRRTRGSVTGGVQAGTGATARAHPSVGAGTAVFVLAVTNLVMVAVMAVAPLHMVAHSHHLDIVGVVVSIHVLCMLAPAPLAGWLADRAGTHVVAGLGAVLILVAGVTGAFADPNSALSMTVVLAMFGLGWCAGVVAGSVMVADSLSDAQRARAEGIGEVAMGTAAGVGAPLAGLVVAFGGFSTLVATASVVSLTMLYLGWWTVRSRVDSSANAAATRADPRRAQTGL